MPELKPLYATGSATPADLNIGDIRIVENDQLALASVTSRTGREQDLRQAATSGLSLDLPNIQNTAQGSVYTAFWTGPEQWFLSAPIATHEDIVAGIKAALGATASVTEQTGGWVRFEITGASTISMFERLTMLDLATLPAGTAARTSIEHIGSFVLKNGEDSFTVLAPSSYAGSMLHALQLAAKSVV